MLQFMPDVIPMHHDLSGHTDRWGSKLESFIFPVCILLITLFWHWMITIYEKKAAKTNAEKEQMEARSVAKVLGIVGISETVMFGVMDAFILYSSYVEASTGGSEATVDIAKISCLLCGMMLVVVGNFMTKAKKNAVVGIRTVWSMHNDNTWRKSNRVGAICVIAAGLLTIITSVFVNGNVSTILLLVYILLAAVIAVVYSKKVFDEECQKEF